MYARYPELRGHWQVACPTCHGKPTDFVSDNQVCDCREQLQLAKHYARANIGRDYNRRTWTDYAGDEDAGALVQLWLEAHRTNRQNGFGLFLWGSVGVGKTFLASLAAKELVHLGYRVYFETFEQIVSTSTDGWSSNVAKERFMETIISTDFLVVDDIGKEFRSNKSNLVQSVLDSVLRRRVHMGRPTIITTNLKPGEMEEQYGEAIVSLIKGSCLEIDVLGLDWRPKVAAHSKNEMKHETVRKII